jgi:group I intron endonuclease
MHKYHLVYKVVNTINGKFYIGIHSTNDIYDGYMGSGNAICDAVKKYGVENFKKEILNICDTRDDALLIEKQLVTEDLVKSDICYNLKTGGSSGFVYSDEWIKQVSDRAKKNHTNTINSDKAKEKRAIANRKRAERGDLSTPEQRQIISAAMLRISSKISDNVKSHWMDKEHSEWRKSRMRDAERKTLICPHCNMQMKANLARHIASRHG